MNKTPEKDLTIKQRKWLKAYIQTGNATEAAFQVYDCKDRGAASNIGYENVRKLDFAELMEVGGLTDVLLQKKLMEGLDATKTTNAAILITKDGKIEKAEEQGLIELPDQAVRHKFLDTALKLKGRTIDKQKDTTIALHVNQFLDEKKEEYGI